MLQKSTKKIKKITCISCKHAYDFQNKGFYGEFIMCRCGKSNFLKLLNYQKCEFYEK